MKERTVTGMDCIDRKALRDALYDADAITMNGVKITNQFPSADVAPVRHGRWEAWMPDKNGETREFICTGCRFMVEMSWKQKECDYEWCPYCGCKMDKEE